VIKHQLLSSMIHHPSIIASSLALARASSSYRHQSSCEWTTNDSSGSCGHWQMVQRWQSLHKITITITITRRHGTMAANHNLNLMALLLALGTGADGGWRTSTPRRRRWAVKGDSRFKKGERTVRTNKLTMDCVCVCRVLRTAAAAGGSSQPAAAAPYPSAA
jgi:hypothetical protein